MRRFKRYIGDGVYADFDGFSIILTTENGIRTTNTIVLEPPMLENINSYYTNWLKLKEVNRDDGQAT